VSSLNREFVSESPTSNYASRIKYETLKTCRFNGLIKSFSDDPRTRASWSVDYRWLKSGFEKSLRVETRITKNR
jgi:hypothetical protein